MFFVWDIDLILRLSDVFILIFVVIFWGVVGLFVFMNVIFLGFVEFILVFVFMFLNFVGNEVVFCDNERFKGFNVCGWEEWLVIIVIFVMIVFWGDVYIMFVNIRIVKLFKI